MQKERPAAYELQTKALLLQWIVRLAQEDSFVPMHPSKQSDVCKEILTYIGQHYAEHLTVSMVATAVDISPTYFSAFFTERFSQHFSEYLRNIRIEQACVLLLDTTMSVTEIALGVGFNSDSQFQTFNDLTYWIFTHETNPGSIIYPVLSLQVLCLYKKVCNHFRHHTFQKDIYSYLHHEE